MEFGLTFHSLHCCLIAFFLYFYIALPFVLKKYTFLILNLIVFCLVVAQQKEYVRFFNQGNKALLNEKYALAIENFKKAYAIDSLSANINFKLGYSYYILPEFREKAEPYLAKAVLDVTKNYKETDATQRMAPYYAFFYYAEVLHFNHNLNLSVKMFDKYEEYLQDGLTGVDSIHVENHENMLVFDKRDLESAGHISITNLGGNINTAGAEYSPLVDGEEQMLIFTYCGEKTSGAAQGIRTEEGKFFEDIFFSERQPDGTWSIAAPLPGGINTNGHEAAVNLSFDGQTLIVYKDDNGDGNLYYSEKNGKNWGPLQKFGPEINSSYWEPSACFSLDKSVIYFVSDRPGGVGGRDIYRCRRLPNGEWSKAENLGPHINTPDDEEGPFMHANGTDFFFSSQGHKSMGGFDILLAELNQDESFTTPVRLSYPINSTEDDVFYFVSNDEKRVYYSTDKKTIQAKGDKDIYVISIEGVEVCALLRGAFIPAKNTPLPKKLSLRVKDKDSKLMGIYVPGISGEFVAILKEGFTYITNWEQDGKVLRTDTIEVPVGKAYSNTEMEITLEPYRFSGEDLVINEKNGNPNNTGDKVVTENKSTTASEVRDPIEYGRNFNYNVTEFEQENEAKRFLDDILARIKSGSQVKISITSSASRVPTTKFGGSNLRLAQQRATKFKRELVAFLTKNGVDIKNVKFVSKSFVSGPDYKKDGETNREAYRQHQYLKVRVDELN